VLSALGDLLELADERHHLVVIGGSGLVAIGAISRPTRDVDVDALIDREEPRDLADLRQLAPTSADLTAPRAGRGRLAQGPYDDALARALEAFGVEDEGRDT
jgi:hypothetical protein